MIKIKKGMKVFIREDLKIDNCYGVNPVCEGMKNGLVTMKEIFPDGEFTILEEKHYYTIEMIDILKTEDANMSEIATS